MYAIGRGGGSGLARQITPADVHTGLRQLAGWYRHEGHRFRDLRHRSFDHVATDDEPHLRRRPQFVALHESRSDSQVLLDFETLDFCERYERQDRSIVVPARWRNHRHRPCRRKFPYENRIELSTAVEAARRNRCHHHGRPCASRRGGGRRTRNYGIAAAIRGRLGHLPVRRRRESIAKPGRRQLRKCAVRTDAPVSSIRPLSNGAATSCGSAAATTAAAVRAVSAVGRDALSKRRLRAECHRTRLAEPINRAFVWSPTRAGSGRPKRISHRYREHIDRGKGNLVMPFLSRVLACHR